MYSNKFVAALATLIVSYCTKVCLAYPPNYSGEPPTITDDEYDGGYKIPQFNVNYSHPQQHLKYSDQNPYLSYFTTSQTSSTSTATSTSSGSSSSPSTLTSLPALLSSSPSDVISAKPTKPSISLAYVYKAEVPTDIEPEATKIFNAVNLATTTTPSATGTHPLSSSSSSSSYTNENSNTNSNNNTEQDGNLSNKIIGSSVVTSVSVILNGDEPEFTDALGHKVPKPQPSLQVASPIDLLNPDRYEFYTFDENGELVKRLMTMEEIHSIVANGDGEGPTIIHNGPIEDRDPEKNVEDIVNSVQNVLNKEVETNKNSSVDSLPVFDTPDVSSSWSMILPAIFGNTGDVEIFPQQKPQQIVMTPDTELIETSTKESVSTTTKKSKPVQNRKPGHKRRPSTTTTTTTEMTPQVIQEELDSEESVYTGMQQYQHLAATMQNFNGFSQLQMQPIYHKLPDIETSTRPVFVNNQGIVKRPELNKTNVDKVELSDNLAKKPVSVQHKPTPPQRIKKPNGDQTTKRPQGNKQKVKRKPTTTTTTVAPTISTSTTQILSSTTTLATTTTSNTTTTTSAPIISTSTPQRPSSTTILDTTPTSTTTTTTSLPTILTPTTSTMQPPTNSTQTPTATTALPSSKPLKKKKKKPTRQPVHSSVSNAGEETQKPALVGEKRKPLPRPHRPRPKPTQQQNTNHPDITISPDLAAAGSAHQAVTQNKYQHVTYHRPRPKPNKSTTSTTSTTTSTTPTPPPSTTVIISPVPTTSTTPQSESLIIQNFPGYQSEFNDNGAAILTTRVTTTLSDVATTPNSQSISGTSGYPVPSYSIEDPQEYTLSQFKKPPLPSYSLSQHEPKPYEQDKHTQQSFDQILQTLKQPDEIIFNKPSLMPVKYDLEEMANKYIVPVQNTPLKDSFPTINTQQNNYGSSTFSITLQDLEETTSSNEVATKKENETLTTAVTSQNQYEETTDIPNENNTTEDIETTELPSYTIFTDAIKETTSVTKAPESDTALNDKLEEYSTEYTREQELKSNISTTYDSASHIIQQPNYTYGFVDTEQTTEILKPVAEDLSEESKIETRLPVSLPNKAESVTEDEKESISPILVADLKPQLNMEVIKPSEQISMSDFQTQAATVASTLVDGFITSTTDYNMMNSNDTKDEIAFLMSDVIKQISNSNTLPKIQTTNLNDNRYSNQAQLNISFLMKPNKEEPVQPANQLEEEFKNDYVTTDVSETSTLPASQPEEFTTNSLEKEYLAGSTKYEDNITISSDTAVEGYETTTSIINYLGSREKLATTLLSEKTTTEATTERNENNGYIENENENNVDKSTITSADNSPTLSLSNQLEDETTSLKSPILSLSEVHAQQQGLDNEREALFEAADTKTEISELSEVTSLNEELQNNVGIEDMSTIEKHSLENIEPDENISESIEIESNTKTTSAEEGESKDVQITTESSTAINQEDKINGNKIESAIINTDSTDSLKENLHADVKIVDTTEFSIFKDSTEILSSTISEDIDENSTDIDFYITMQPPKENQKDETPIPVEATTAKVSFVEPEANESAIDESKENDNLETTTNAYHMSEESSDELNAMISEEDEADETGESIYEDPYIKLGETTTQKFEISLVNTSQTITQTNENKNKSSETNISETKPTIDVDMPMLAPPQPIHSILEHNVPTDTQQSIFVENNGQTHEVADEEDEDDQFGYQVPKLPVFSSTTNTSSIRSTTTTTAKPKITTTRRLNTLKPVSYFNKQPAYALLQEPIEPSYDKQSVQSVSSLEKNNPPYKVVAYAMPTPQQRPMHRPPQLSNLMISATQATRPPVRLEPSPNNTKGLEASLANLDSEILTFARLCNELAFAYWKSITSEKISSARSLVISPFALTSMLSMIFLGARGSTSGEMNDVLKLDDMVTFNPHLVFKNITDSVEKTMDSNIATTAFVREIFSDRANGKILQFFKEKTQQLYAGHVEEVNFHVVNDIIRRRTNLLVKRHSMGKVLEYLRTNSVWVNGPLATISANLFQTDCSHGSIQERDGELFFQVHPTVRQRRLVPIPAVLFKSGFTAGYEPNLDATVVAFGRTQDTTSMIYVMPGHSSSISPSENLDRFEKQLMEAAISKNAWSNILKSLMDRPGMEVQLPRFSHRSFINATLGLQKMGLGGLFKSEYADLGGLTGSFNRDIYLSDMIQINTFSTCGEEKIADHHHVEMYPAPPLRKRNKDVEAQGDDQLDSSEAIIDFGSLVQDSVLGRGFYDDLLDPKYLELPLPLRPRQARVPDVPRIKFDKPFLYFVRHNPTGMILFMGRFNPRLLP